MLHSRTLASFKQIILGPLKGIDNRPLWVFFELLMTFFVKHERAEKYISRLILARFTFEAHQRGKISERNRASVG